MTRISLTDVAHALIAERLLQGNTAIDATLGNGHDVLFLASCVGMCGRVYGFDIQRHALEASRKRLMAQEMQNRAELIQACHSDMERLLPAAVVGNVKAIMFNLGYLPGGDKQLITCVETTLPALDAACRLLAVGGILTVLAYPGHTGGDQETDSIQQWCKQLNRQVFEYQTIESGSPNPKSPRLFVIRKQG